MGDLWLLLLRILISSILSSPSLPILLGTSANICLRRVTISHIYILLMGRPSFSETATLRYHLTHLKIRLRDCAAMGGRSPAPMPPRAARNPIAPGMVRGETYYLPPGRFWLMAGHLPILEYRNSGTWRSAARSISDSPYTGHSLAPRSAFKETLRDTAYKHARGGGSANTHAGEYDLKHFAFGPIQCPSAGYSAYNDDIPIGPYLPAPRS